MRSFLITLLVLFTVNVSGQQAETKEPAKANARPEKEVKKESFDDADVKTMSEKCARFETEAGLIEMEMFPEHAPEAVRSFLNIVSIGYLDTTTFSRVVPGFVIQGGDLYSRESEVTYEIGMRARKTLPDEPNRILHERGILSMARGDEANTATTGFFILVGNGHHLDGKFTAFGKVTKGMDVVDAIAKAPVTDEKPEKPVRIKTAKVFVCGNADN